MRRLNEGNGRRKEIQKRKGNGQTRNEGKNRKDRGKRGRNGKKGKEREKEGKKVKRNRKETEPRERKWKGTSKKVLKLGRAVLSL